MSTEHMRCQGCWSGARCIRSDGMLTDLHICSSSLHRWRPAQARSSQPVPPTQPLRVPSGRRSACAWGQAQRALRMAPDNQLPRLQSHSLKPSASRVQQRPRRQPCSRSGGALPSSWALRSEQRRRPRSAAVALIADSSCCTRSSPICSSSASRHAARCEAVVQKAATLVSPESLLAVMHRVVLHSLLWRAHWRPRCGMAPGSCWTRCTICPWTVCTYSLQQDVSSAASCTDICTCCTTHSPFPRRHTKVPGLLRNPTPLS
jgi:hypothetical protein